MHFHMDIKKCGVMLFRTPFFFLLRGRRFRFRGEVVGESERGRHTPRRRTDRAPPPPLAFPPFRPHSAAMSDAETWKIISTELAAAFTRIADQLEAEGGAAGDKRKRGDKDVVVVPRKKREVRARGRALGGREGREIGSRGEGTTIDVAAASANGRPADRPAEHRVLGPARPGALPSPRLNFSPLGLAALADRGRPRPRARAPQGFRDDS